MATRMPTPEQYMASLEEPPKKRKWKKRLFVCFLIILAIFLVFAIYIFNNLRKISVNPLNLGGLNSTNGRVNILILGVCNPGHAGEKLSDTNILMSIDLKSKKVGMISLPRDLRVPIPGHGYGKINQANALGGPKLAEETVANVLDQPINYYVESDFSGLVKMVDAVGGIEVSVKQRLYDPEYPCANDERSSCGLEIKPGIQHMDGATALEYARCRKGTCGNDFGRAARQQEVIDLVAAKIFKPTAIFNPVLVSKFSEILANDIKTDMSINQLARLDSILHKRSGTTNIVFTNSPGGGLVGALGSSDLLPADGTFEDMQAKAANVFSEESSLPKD